MANIFDEVMKGNLSFVKENKSLDYNEEGFEVFTEAVYPEALPYLKTMHKVITLPKGEILGRGNLCFLYTPTFKDSIELMTSKTNFMGGNHYYYYFYNPTYSGRLYTRTYRFKELSKRVEMYKEIERKTKLHPYNKLSIQPKETRNMYYDLHRYLEIFDEICGKLTIAKKVSSYWNFMKSILLQENEYKKKFVLIDVAKYPFGNSIAESLNNPVYMMYYTLFKYPALINDLDIDFYMFTNQRCLKVNPSKITDEKAYLQFSIQMKRLYSYVDKKATILDAITDEENIEEEEIVNDAKDSLGEVNKEVDKTPVTDVMPVSTSVIIDDDVDKKLNAKIAEAHKAVEAKPEAKLLSKEEKEEKILKKAEEDINKDKALMNEIYDKTVAKQTPKSAASTARDEMLRKAQKDIKVGNMTIGEIEKIKANKIPIEVNDISKSVKTTNENMKHIRYENIDKGYVEKLMPKDITDAILALNNKSIPMFVRDIKITDSSDELNYKETYTILLEDANRQRHTVKVDIPKILENRFLYLGGNRKVITHQDFLIPVVKTKEDIVQVVTNYNKMFIQRVETKSSAPVERLKKLLKSHDDLKAKFTFGNVLPKNKEFITFVDYDELAKLMSQYKDKKCYIAFDQTVLKEYATAHNIKVPKNNLFVGTDKNGAPIFIDVDTQTSKEGKTLLEYIVESFPEELQSEYASTRSPKRIMYTRVKVMEQFIGVAYLLGFWEGLSTVMKKLGVEYRLEDKIPKELSANEETIKFADCVLVYKATTAVSLIMNGFRIFDTSKFNIADMDTQEPYMGYLIKVYGKASIANALMNVYEFMIDPITLEILDDLHMPKDIVSLIIYAVNLLADSQYTSEIDEHTSRIRKDEIIPAILYERLAKNYIIYRNSNGKKKFSIPQDCVIKELVGLKTVEEYSSLNPTLELQRTRAVSTKGFRGANLDESYTPAKRAYDDSMIGIIAPGTSPDGSVGVSKTLTMEPSITSLRGYVDINNDKLDKMKDVNLFSPSELSIPLGATRDDPTRLGFQKCMAESLINHFNCWNFLLGHQY